MKNYIYIKCNFRFYPYTFCYQYSSKIWVAVCVADKTIHYNDFLTLTRTFKFSTVLSFFFLYFFLRQWVLNMKWLLIYYYLTHLWVSDIRYWGTARYGEIKNVIIDYYQWLTSIYAIHNMYEWICVSENNNNNNNILTEITTNQNGKWISKVIWEAMILN